MMLACSLHGAMAQQSSFDLFTFKQPAGWKKTLSADGNILSLEKVNQKTKNWGRINILISTRSNGSAAADFSHEWEYLAVKQYNVTGLKEMDSIAANGWVIKAGMGAFTYNGKKTNVMTSTFTGFGLLGTIVTMNTGAEFTDPIATFMESVGIDDAVAQKRAKLITASDPVVKNDPAPPADTRPSAANSGNYKFNTTNFDNGWTSVIKDEWVEVTKGDMRVYLFYAVPFDGDKFTGTGLAARDYYWDNYVSKYFRIETKQYRDPEIAYDLKPDYVEGWAKDPRTGERRFIAMRLTNSSKAADIIVVSAKNEADIYKQFPRAYTALSNDISPMSYYNRFAVCTADIAGKWTDGGNTEAAEFYYASPAGYSYGGMTVAATAADFDFHQDGTYTSHHRGAYGALSNMNTYDQTYKGRITVTDWKVSATNRWKGQTEDMEAWFIVVRGGRILKLNGSVAYTLVRSKD